MCLRTLAKFFATGLSVLVLAACGGGSNSNSGPTDPETGNLISVFGSDGPMAGADVAVYGLQAYLDDSATAENLLAAAATTDAVTALADDLELSLDAGTGPFVVVVTANGDTIDLSTGAAPVISEVTTIVASLTDARVYATPLTTLAVALAMDGETVADNVIGFKLVASQLLAKAFIGFGMDTDIDIFTVPPVLDENTTSADVQADVAQYRGANEAFAFIVEDSALDFASIIVDASDGILNDAAVIAAVQGLDVLDVLSRVSAASIADLLDADATGLADGYVIDAGVDEAPSNVIDSDTDGVNNADDDFDFDASETTDSDNDTVGDNVDNCLVDANTDQLDTDSDGAGDVCDSTPTGDTDNDTIDNAVDNCPAIANTDQLDTDSDGAGNVCDSTPNGDDDSDTIDNLADNCPAIANTDQLDTDSDGAGDVCDAFPNDADNDIDGDTVSGDIDNCPTIANTNQLDSDSDGAGDVCDSFPNDADNDIDGDTVSGDIDNCPTIANTNQLDSDSDGAGDVCDSTPNGDDDSDTIDNLADNCPAIANTDQLDTDSDGAGDVCDAFPNDADNDIDGDTVSGDIDNCPSIANTDQADLDGDLTGNVCDIDADADGANGDGAGGPSVTDSNDLDANITIDSDSDTVDDLTDNCPNTSNTDQADLDGDLTGNVCDIDADGDGANGDGAGGPSATDSNDLDANVSVDADSDNIDDSVDNCPSDANNDQSDIDNDTQGDVCDSDIDGDTLANAVDPDPLNSESKYHFDFFYNQLSSATEAFKAAVVGETVTQADGTIDIGVGVDSTTLDLGSDETGNGSFDVRADYATTEESLSYTGTDFSSATPTLTDVTVSDDNLANTVSLSNGVLSFTDETVTTSLSAWGNHNFIGSGRVTLNGASTTLAAAQEAALSLLSFADGASDDTDLNADYGVVILDTVYGNDSEFPDTNEVTNLFSVVGVFGFDGAGALALSAGSSYISGLGIADGFVAFLTDLPATTGTYTVSPTGAVDLVIAGESSYGFADSEGDLFTTGDPASRMYGVKLGAGNTSASLANTSFDLSGLVIDSSNATLNVSTYAGLTATFSADGTTLTIDGSVDKAVAAFSDSALPSVATASQAFNLTSDAFTVADNGRLSPITFADSGLELEGFIAANGGLLLRVVNMETAVGAAADPAGLQVGATLYPLADAPFDGVTPQVCDEPASAGACAVPLRDIAESELLSVVTDAGQILIGTWSNGGSGGGVTTTPITADVRAGSAPSLDPIAADTTVTITQGVLFGIPEVLAP